MSHHSGKQHPLAFAVTRSMRSAQQQRPRFGLPPASPERRSLWRRLSSAQPARRQDRRVSFSTYAATATILEEAVWEPSAPQPAVPRRGSKRARPKAWSSLCAAAVRSLLSVALFVTDALGLSARARAAYTSVLSRASELRGRWASRVAAGAGLTRKLSSLALESLGRGVTKTERVAGLLRRAMSAEGRLDTVGAIRCYQAASDLEPDNTEPLVGLAKCISDRVFEPAIFADGDLARSMATQAASLSERAIALKPDNPRAYLASAVALGRLALWSSNQRKIEISRTVRERVEAALQLSPEDDIALHVLGRWEYEMVCVGFAVRMVVKIVYGGLEVGSLQAAHTCLARAIELRPERLVHRVVFARILLKMGKREEAVDQLEAACRLRVEDVNAVHEREEAVKMLARLGRPTPPPAQQPEGATPGTPASPSCSWEPRELPLPVQLAFT